MKNLLIKEFRLSASALTYGFIAASLMTMLPGYPILMGAFSSVWVYFIPFRTDGKPTISCIPCCSPSRRATSFGRNMSSSARSSF